jgi:alkanesulfonate monooxygenase SsuD/methylene tetrahydromethanopterin reductase-like flavin-dependent oxidoreductase (luciferase family)
MKIGVVVPAAEADGDGATPSWSVTRSFAVAAEQRALDSVWMFDHLFYRNENGQIEGMHEAWTIVSALAAVTSRVDVGTIVLCSSFRSPGLVAKMAATADNVSGGRIILGVGAGWHDAEYEAFGHPTDHRVNRFEEALQIITPLLRGESVTLDGRYHRAREAVLAPPPDRRVPLLVAASKPRMLRLTARYADAWNTAWYGAADDRLRQQLRALDQALKDEGRDPAAVERTVGMIVVDPDTNAQVEEDAFAGTVDGLARAWDDFERLGIAHIIVVTQPMTERSLDRLAAAVRLRSGHA